MGHEGSRCPAFAELLPEIRLDGGAGVQEEHGNQICIILWADNFRIVSQNRTGFQRMMEELAGEIVSKGMEWKQESPGWTSTYAPKRWIGRFGIVSFVKEFDMLGYADPQGAGSARLG